MVLKYSNEGRGPYLVDLTHKAKWDLQDKNLAARKPLGLDIPALPGACAFQKGVLINRMNPTQSAIWHLLADAPALPGEPGYTDVTSAWASGLPEKPDQLRRRRNGFVDYSAQ
ncbi:hypothetical protein Desgi_4031 [Desulfoscipio gibsoniae DSM 7213]|uniref:Uncharacterized protein n=1 Tax=Desulfoscipio gibsoniae DSM 7213 TaxID=767817 RepID=R4KP17_9FIRM|nr:hypothetical protein Desgi_4031 [Desulfoscipio gibsoniae DSM 7213]